MVFTLDPSASNMEEHTKLIDGLSDPSDQLIHQIPHQQTSAEPNILCFIWSKYTLSSPATLTSIRKPLSSATVLLKYLLGSKTLYNQPMFNNLPSKTHDMQALGAAESHERANTSTLLATWNPPYSME